MEQVMTQLPIRTRRCPACSEEILVSAQKCKHCGEYLTPAARRSAGIAPAKKNQQTRKITDPMGPAVVSLFFFLPLGIVALIFAAQFKSKLQAGDYSGAEQAAGLAKLMAGIAAGLGMLIVIVLFAN